MSIVRPSRGQIWSANFEPVKGREQGGIRPALILSVDQFNFGPADLAIVLPVTSKNKNQPLHVSVTPPEGGLSKLSFVKCEDIRSISKERLTRLFGEVSAHTLAEVTHRVRVLLGL